MYDLVCTEVELMLLVECLSVLFFFCKFMDQAGGRMVVLVMKDKIYQGCLVHVMSQSFEGGGFTVGVDGWFC